MKRRDCCASSVVTGGTFNRGNDPNYPATVSTFRLDTYEVTVGRFKAFVAAYQDDVIAEGAGANPNNPSDTGWGTVLAENLESKSSTLTIAIQCSSTFQTWASGNDRPTALWVSAFATNYELRQFTHRITLYGDASKWAHLLLFVHGGGGDDWP